MSVLDGLSSQIGDRTARSNHAVAARCLDKPSLLTELVGGLDGRDAALAGDCAEVLTLVAEQRPDLVAPYAGALSPLIAHPTTRVRWEATHALALVARAVPEAIAPLLPTLGEMVRADASTIVRDYATAAIGNYAATGPAAATAACPLLLAALDTWGGKHAGRALKGLTNVARSAPAQRQELRAVAEGHADSSRGVVRKAARDLLRELDRETTG